VRDAPEPRDAAGAGRHVAPPPEDDDEDAYTVRPYAVTGGRTSSTSADLPVEALVQALGPADVTMTAEKRRILELTATEYLSIAELSAHVKLPVPVVRVVVGDLADSKKVRVHGTTRSDDYNPSATLSVLESVLNGISSL
jgi:hypothetical protein